MHCRILAPGYVFSLALASVLPALLAAGLLVASVAHAADDSPWVQRARIDAFDGRYGYEAYPDRAIVIDNATGRRDTVRVTGRSAVGESFRKPLAEDAKWAGNLGPAVSPEVAALGGKLRVQVFRSGILVYEPSSRTLWANWHTRARAVGESAAPPPGASPAAPDAVWLDAIIDETGKITPADRTVLAAALRAFKARHGITIGLAYLKPGTREAGESKVRQYRTRFREQGIQAEKSAVFALRDSASYTWVCDDDVLKRISFEQVRAAWSATDDIEDYAKLTLQFLSLLSKSLDGAPLAPPTPTPVKPPVAPPSPSGPAVPSPVKPPAPATPVPGMPTSGQSVPAAVQAGAVVAEARIGPAGGRVAAPGSVEIEFPDGALKTTERIVLKRSLGTSPSGRFFFVERERPDALLARPAKVRFTLPPGVKHEELAAAQEAGGGLWIVCPSAYDAKTRTFVAEVSHFSGFGWFNKANCIRVVGGAITAVGTGLVWLTAAGVGLVAWPATVGVGTAAIIFSVAGVGAAASNPVYETYQRMGLDGVLTLGVEPQATDWVVRWKSADYPSATIVTVALNDKGCMVYALPGRHTREELVGALSQPGSQSAAIAAKIHSAQAVPAPVWTLTESLLKTKAFYRQGNYDPPGTVEVLVDDNLAKSKENEPHLGEWDDKFLRIHSNLVKSLNAADAAAAAAKRDEMLATIAHEYWHVLYFARGYKSKAKFPWLDEGIATVMESEVGPGYAKSFEMYKAPTIAPQFERGLLNIGDPYCMWPVGKYWLHRTGASRVNDAAQGKIDGSSLAGASGEFMKLIRSLLVREESLPDPIPATDSGAPVRSGWYGLDPSDWIASQASSSGRGYLVLGKNAANAAPPLSYTLRRVMVAPPETAAKREAAPLIVRRQTPDDQEVYIALKPEYTDGGQARVGGRRASSDVRQSAGGVSVPATWLGKLPALVMLGFVNPETASGSGSPLLLYELRPPERVAVAVSGGNVALRWQPPAPGQGLAPTDCLRGYRVFYRDKSGRETMLPDLLVKPDATSAVVPAQAMPGFVEVGMASEDAALRDARDAYLLSAIAWPAVEAGSVRVGVTEEKPGSLDGYGPMDVLAGKPIPNAPVVCTFLEKGRPVRLELSTDKRGVCLFVNVPLDTDIQITASGVTRTVRCTAAKPQASVTFGWGGHTPTKEGAPPNTLPPSAP